MTAFQCPDVAGLNPFLPLFSFPSASVSEFLLLAIVRVLTLLMFGISRSHQNFIFKNQNNRLSLVPKCYGANSDLIKCFWLSSRAHKTILPLAWRVCLVCHCFLLSSFVGEVIWPWEGSLLGGVFLITFLACLSTREWLGRTQAIHVTEKPEAQNGRAIVSTRHSKEINLPRALCSFPANFHFERESGPCLSQGSLSTCHQASWRQGCHVWCSFPSPRHGSWSILSTQPIFVMVEEKMWTWRTGWLRRECAVYVPSGIFEA